MKRFAWLAAILAGLAATTASADFVVPLSTETSGLNTPLRNAGRTYMSYYNSSILTSLTQPTFINGLSLRISQAGNGTIPSMWPSQNLTFGSFTMQLSNSSAAVRAAGELPTLAAFASYQGANVSTVYSGPLTITPNSYSNVGAPRPFGAEIIFQQPFLYTPGDDLLLYIQHSGYTPAGEPQPFFAVGSFANGVADAVSALTGTSTTATGFTSPLIVQFDVVSTPLPPSALLGLAIVPVLGLLRRKRA